MQIDQLAKATKKSMNLTKLAVALIKLRYGLTEIFDVAIVRANAGISRAIERHKALSNRPGLVTNAFHPPPNRLDSFTNWL